VAIGQSASLIVEDIDEQKKPPTGEQQRIKSLNDQAKRYRGLARQAKAQDRLKKAKQSAATVGKSISY
jgi:cell wall assembly regulator SMI1